MTTNTFSSFSSGTVSQDPVPIDTVVIGAGQAGLAMGYHLRRAGRAFVILDADERVGDCWRRRYDSLRLFSLPRYASLPGWKLPVRGFATRDQFADYLQSYAERFSLPVRGGERVSGVIEDGDRLLVTASTRSFLADNVIVATGAHQRPAVPALADDLSPAIRQLTSVDYAGPAQFAPGAVLVVGAGNSGTDVALDAAAAGHQVLLAGRHPGQVPFDIDRASGRLLIPLVMFVFRHVLTLRTPMGRKAHAGSHGHGVNLVRNKLADLDAAGIERIGRVERVIDGLPATAEGPGLDVGTVVWCCGSVADHRFLEVSVLRRRWAEARPRRQCGARTDVPGSSLPVRARLCTDPGRQPRRPPPRAAPPPGSPRRTGLIAVSTSARSRGYDAWACESCAVGRQPPSLRTRRPSPGGCGARSTWIRQTTTQWLAFRCPTNPVHARSGTSTTRNR